MELEWNDVTEPDDVRWSSVLILHYRRPLSGPVMGVVPRLAQVREVTSIVERARELPSLHHLVVHFIDGPGGFVLADSLLERHAWLDCSALDRQTVTFSLRRD